MLERIPLERLLRQSLQGVGVELCLVGQRFQRVAVLVRKGFERAIFAAHLRGVIWEARGGRRTRAGAGGGVGEAVRG